MHARTHARTDQTRRYYDRKYFHRSGKASVTLNALDYRDKAAFREVYGNLAHEGDRNAYKYPNSLVRKQSPDAASQNGDVEEDSDVDMSSGSERNGAKSPRHHSTATTYVCVRAHLHPPMRALRCDQGLSRAVVSVSAYARACVCMCVHGAQRAEPWK